MLSYLGRYAEYWWATVSSETKLLYVWEKKNISKTVTISDVDSGDQTLLVSRSFSLDENTGNITLDSPETLTIRIDNSDVGYDLSALKKKAPCYISGLYGDPNGVYYLPTGSNCTIAARNSLYNSFTVYSPAASESVGSGQSSSYLNANTAYSNVTAQVVNITAYTIPAGETTYEHSTDRNAYPDSGTVDEITYQYLGVPFENMVTAPKIDQGTYAGTGKYGSSNQNTLTFDFKPKIVFIRGPRLTSSDLTFVCFINDAIYAEVLTEYGGTSLSTLQTIAWDENTVKWYNSGSATLQLNASGKKYTYVAFG